MLKLYHVPKSRESPVRPVVTNSVLEQDCTDGDGLRDHVPKLENSSVLKDLDAKLSHIRDGKERKAIKDLILEYSHIFSDVPGRTHLLHHDIDVGDAVPVKQTPYRLSPVKKQALDDELQYMLDNDIIEPCESEWSSPCLLVPKKNNTFRVVQDYRRVNALSRSDCFPNKRLEDCIEKVGKARFISTFDMVKGYWAVPLTERAKDVSAFATPNGLYRYKVMAMGLKNAAATYQRLMNQVIDGLSDCESFQDDAVIGNDTFQDHLAALRDFFERVSQAGLTINLVKSEFCHAQVKYLGHVLGHGQVRPMEAKVKTMVEYPTPQDRKSLMRFLGMVGFYRRFCPNLSEIVAPLTSLLKKGVCYIWDDICEESFKNAKAILLSEPVLLAPDFDRQFNLAVDASDLAIGSVLLQEDDSGLERPVSYYSKKLNSHQMNYSTIEKEALSLVLSLQHFSVYLESPVYPVIVFTDHNPLVFLYKMRNHNKRLMRWCMYVQEFNLKIKHIKGKDNVIADALSRIV
jgi:hypothetical protein